MSRFTFTSDNDFDETHIDYSFDAETIYDILDHMKYFLRGCGYEVAGDISLIPTDTGDFDESEYQKDYAFDNIPNNNWPFGESKPASMPKHSEHENGWYEWIREEAPVRGIPALTTVDLAQIKPLDLSSMTVTDLSTLTSRSWTEWSAPTMAPLTSRQVESWSLPTEGIKALTSADIAAWTIPMPGTAGSAQYKWPNKDAN